MVRLPGYVLKEVVLADGDFVLCRAERVADGTQVLARVPSSSSPPLHALKRLDHEFSLAGLLDPRWALHPVELIHPPSTAALVYEDFPGVALSTLSLPLDISEFLGVAVAATSSVAALHDAGLVHRDLRPENLIFAPANCETRLTGFGLAAPRPLHAVPPLEPLVVEGSWSFKAPEQTGRLNRAIDEQSDLYALGAVFYQLLTGQLPCFAEDPLEFIHRIVAVLPPPPETLRSPVPPVVSSLVMKLLAKLPEERYLTAAGLRADLLRCREQWQRQGGIAPFELGERDICSRLNIPQHLYGREQEFSALLRGYAKVLEGGAPQLAVISGYAGVGKSVLVAELRAPVTRQRSFFVAGKFEQYLRAKPYATFAQALAGLMRQVLMESDEVLGRWRDAMVEAVGVNGRLITELVPETELLIGPQPPVPELPLTEAENRFHQVFRRVLQLFCREDRPLVLFLDDLQWADPGTLKLLTDILTNRETRSLLVLVTYRDSEVSPSHPAMLSLGDIRRSGVDVLDLVLQPLQEEDVNALVADTLHADRERTSALAALLMHKTGGNPFFLIQFLSTLYHDGLLQCGAENFAWEWDLAQIRLRQYTDNVVDFLVQKVSAFPVQTIRCLHLAACIGISAEVPLLATITGAAESDVEARLAPAVQEGLVAVQEGDYRFIHDRVQQAAYSLGTDDSRALVHLSIARELAARYHGDAEEHLFDIVGHFNRGRRFIDRQEEQVAVGELNLKAGRRAQASAAYRSAIEYFAAGIKTLGESCRHSQAALGLALVFERGKCSWLAGDLDQAQQQLERALADAGTTGQKVDILMVQSKVAMTKGDPPGAARLLLKALRLLGVAWTAHPEEREVLSDYQEVWNLLGPREIATLIDLPPMNDPTVAQIMAVLSELYLPAYWIDVNLQLLVTCRMVNLSLRHGNNDASPMGYAGLGRLLGPKFQRYREGYQFGKLGYDLVERLKLVGYKARISDLFGISTSFWVVHLRQGLEFARISFKAAGESGDLPYACYACMHIVTYRLALGDPLWEIASESETLLDFVQNAKYGEVADMIFGLQRLIRDLRGEGEAGRDHYSSKGELERRVRSERSTLVLVWYLISKLQDRFLMGDFAGAVEVLSELAPAAPSFTTQLNYTQYVFYAALALAAHYHEVPPYIQADYRARIEDHLADLALWAQHGPENFRHSWSLVAAELARLSGNVEQAAGLYHEAIEQARAQGFVHREALAQELAARFHLALGDTAKGRTYLLGARYSFARWGAAGKVEQLSHEFPHILAEGREAAAFSVEQLDLLAIVRASQAISQETELFRVVERLLKVLMEQSGADRAMVFLLIRHELRAVAEAAVEGVSLRVQQWPDGTLAADAPRQLLNYVHRVREPLLLDDARDATPFSEDPYFALHRPLSVGCLPIIRQKELVGVIYLENSKLARTFTTQRIGLLELLAAQSAITLQNAQLFDELRSAKSELEDRVRERTAELTQALQELHAETEERLQAVEELRKKEQMLLQQSRVAAMGELLVNISHHWRQPMNLIAVKVQELGLTYAYGGFSKELLDGNIAEVMKTLKSMSQTITDFQGLLSHKPQTTSFEVDEVVVKTLEMIEGTFQSLGIRIDVSLSGAGQGHGNRSEYGQALLNLLTNARDALLEHREKDRLITVRSRVEAGKSLVTVTDNAGGIPADIMPLIFDAYFTTKETGKGTGLGLFLSKMIIEKNMGGRLSVRNVEDGAEFTIEV